MKQLQLKALTWALAILWGASVLILGWTAMFGWGYEIVRVLSSLYIGYKATFFGAIIGGIWGFFDGAIGGAIFCLLYNWIAKKSQEQKK